MVVTIYEGFNNHEVILGSTDVRFRDNWGNMLRVSLSCLYSQLETISYWCNNELHEECLFEVD